MKKKENEIVIRNIEDGTVKEINVVKSDDSLTTNSSGSENEHEFASCDSCSKSIKIDTIKCLCEECCNKIKTLHYISVIPKNHQVMGLALLEFFKSAKEDGNISANEIVCISQEAFDEAYQNSPTDEEKSSESDEKKDVGNKPKTDVSVSDFHLKQATYISGFKHILKELIKINKYNPTGLDQDEVFDTLFDAYKNSYELRASKKLIEVEDYKRRIKSSDELHPLKQSNLKRIDEFRDLTVVKVRKTRSCIIL